MTGFPTTIHVISLDSATARWEAVQATHKAFLPGTRLKRFRAISAEETAANRISGRCTWSEKACYMSHVQCLSEIRSRQDHAWIVEDDMMAFADTMHRISCALAMLESVPWDILFTHVKFSSNPLARIGRRPSQAMDQLKAQTVAKLGDAAFYGSSSYLVNRASFGKVQDAISLQPRVNLAWDMFLKWCSARGALDIYTCAPSSTGTTRALSQILRG